MNNSYLEYRRALKLGKASPAQGKQAKSADSAADDKKDAEAPVPAKSPRKGQESIKKPGAKKKGMRKVSKKRAKQERQYRPVRKKFLQEHSTCELNLPGCQGIATQIHHQTGRENGRLLNIDDFRSACGHCHKIVTEKSREAIAAGHSKSRLGKADRGKIE